MRIESAEWSAGELRLKTSDPDAIRFAIGFKQGDFSITPSKKHRSADANALAWKLIDRLAAALHMSKEEVYRNAIRDIGGNSEIVCVQEGAYETLRRCWVGRGLGWQVEVIPSKLKGCVNAILYYGSSAYDTKQMSVLIDHLKQDCESLGIPVEPDERIRSLLESWDKK